MTEQQPHFLYQFKPGPRADLARNPDAWTEADEQTFQRHWAYLSQAAEDGVLILAGRAQDGIGPALVIFEAADEAAARAFMESDPFVAEGLFRAELHPFKAALGRALG